jgi:hypothetical protein
MHPFIVIGITESEDGPVMHFVMAADSETVAAEMATRHPAMDIAAIIDREQAIVTLELLEAIASGTVDGVEILDGVIQ